MPVTLSLHYLPCIYWFKLFLQTENSIDLHEHYIKQSFRNRCVILSANGPLSLTIPVKKKNHQPVLEIEIENEFNWQKQHWEAIRSAYNSSPYFMYYQHHFEPLYHAPFTNLTEFNLKALEVCLNILRTKKLPVLSDQYIQPSNADFRNRIHPKIKPEVHCNPYLQVFTEKFEFQPNLSIIDLLFNKGNESMEYLMTP